MMKIADISLKNNIFLAPMAGVTDLAFRIICDEFGAGLSYTEMVSAKALSFSDKKTGKLKRQPKWFFDALRNAKTAEERSIIRSKTFPGIAEAMAKQWG